MCCFRLNNIRFRTVRLIAGLCLAALSAGASAGIEPLKIQGGHFVDPSGHAVRFWGQNLVACYPDHATADALAANLASLQVNLVRPHHILRPSSDWNPQMTSGSLLTYKENSREFDADALDRFDYLNAALGHQGIYLAFSINWTRRYLPGDVGVMTTDAQDQKAWSDAMEELNGWPWKKAFDVYKMLPVIDERAARLNEEFAKKFLTHVNPYTHKSYAADPQVLSIEALNEASTEYIVICGNKLPDYWQKQLLKRWADYAAAHGVDPGDLYNLKNPAQVKARAAFLTGLDQAYFERIKRAVRGAGCQAALCRSNLWEGDDTLSLDQKIGDYVEDHAYWNPLVAADRSDLFYLKAVTQLANKPYFVGELNESEGKKIATEAPTRTQLALATAAYGSLQDWSGLEWFAWTHGAQAMGTNGWAANEGRSADIGHMAQDGMMLDHMRTAGILFRRGLLQPSTDPITVHLDQSNPARGYQDMMRHKIQCQPGWQNIHRIRNSFDPIPAGQATAKWMTQSPANPLVSDTGQIVKDIQRKQLTVAAPAAEAFSGYLDGNAPAKLKHLALADAHFATVIAVADDSKPLAESERIIISRTGLDQGDKEIDGPTIELRDLKTPPPGRHWHVHVTRATGGTIPDKDLEVTSGQTTLALPTGAWHECELTLR